MLIPRSALLALALPAVLFLSACGDKTVSKSQVQDRITSELGAKLEGKVTDVTCPEDLEAKVGGTLLCEMSFDDGKSYEVKVTVKTMKGDKANFDMEVTKQL